MVMDGNCIAVRLVDLKFADDIMMFAFSIELSMDMLRSLVGALRNVGPILNVSKAKLLTTQAQPPEHVWVDLVRSGQVACTPEGGPF